MSDLTELTIREAARLLRLHSFSAAELVTAHIDLTERRSCGRSRPKRPTLESRGVTWALLSESRWP